ncbi:MAG: choice-of-anchor tandem repeat GloVer-containing protein [Terriglobales bacterium]
MTTLFARVFGLAGFSNLSSTAAASAAGARTPARSERRLRGGGAMAIALLLLLGAPVLGYAQYEVLYNFCSQANCADGGEPRNVNLIQDASGNFYGTSSNGGAYGGGTVFKVDPTGHETVLYSFCGLTNCADGAHPYAGLIEDSAGDLYGTTNQGGAYGGGTVFMVDAAETETVIYSFCSVANCADGAGPVAGLILDSGGTLYGTTASGGNPGPANSGGGGVVFKVDTSGVETVLYAFCPSAPSCLDGVYPLGGVIRDSSGNLYGTTEAGGTGSVGTVFEVDSSNNETVLYSFCNVSGCKDGNYPQAGVVADAAGNLYGTTEFGGANYESGGVFKLAPPGQPGGDWTETTLYSFCNAPSCADGYFPLSGLIQDAAGNLYGTTEFGGTGSGGSGTVYKVDGSGNETVLYIFCSAANCTDGENPFGGVTRDAGGNLYGTALGGGSAGGGVVYKIAAEVAVTPASVNFGNVELCHPKKEVLTVTNNSSAKVHLGPISFVDVVGNPNDFNFHEYCNKGTINPGASCFIGVKFSPDALKTDSATLDIVTSAPGSPLLVPITATGVADPNCHRQ